MYDAMQDVAQAAPHPGSAGNPGAQEVGNTSTGHHRNAQGMGRAEGCLVNLVVINLAVGNLAEAPGFCMANLADAPRRVVVQGQLQLPGFGVGNLAAKLKRQPPRTTFTPPRPPPAAACKRQAVRGARMVTGVRDAYECRGCGRQSRPWQAATKRHDLCPPTQWGGKSAQHL